VSLAASHQISPEITLLAELQWTNWSVVRNLRIERPDGSAISDQAEQWHSTWFGSIGATYRPSPNWTFRTGFAIDPSPVRDEFRTARLPDTDRYWLAVGLGYRWSDAFRLDAAYARVFGGTVPVSELSQTGDVLSGQAASHADIVSLSATLRF
jgi:long-chain fatty acid transport protein